LFHYFRNASVRGAIWAVFVAIALLAAVGALASPSAAEEKGSKIAPRKTDPLLAESPSDPYGLSRIQAEFRTDFQRYETRHFSIFSDADEDMVVGLKRLLERTYRWVVRIGRRSGFELKPIPTKLHIIFFDSWDDYGEYALSRGLKPEGTFGFYNERDNRCAFFNASNSPEVQDAQARIQRRRQALRNSKARADKAKRRDSANSSSDRQLLEVVRRVVSQSQKRVSAAENRIESRAETINQSVVQHEAAHQLLFNFGILRRAAHNPLWLAEGLACLFETPPGSSGSGPAAVNRMRLRDYRRASESGRLVALPVFLSSNSKFIKNDSSLEVGYAQSWALVYYLRRTKRKDFESYLRNVSKRDPGRKYSAGEEIHTFEQYFGPIDKRLEKRFQRAIIKLR
jgi:hypothetical protein